MSAEIEQHINEMAADYDDVVPISFRGRCRIEKRRPLSLAADQVTNPIPKMGIGSQSNPPTTALLAEQIWHLDFLGFRVPSQLSSQQFGCGSPQRVASSIATSVSTSCSRTRHNGTCCDTVKLGRHIVAATFNPKVPGSRPGRPTESCVGSAGPGQMSSG